MFRTGRLLVLVLLLVPCRPAAARDAGQVLDKAQATYATVQDYSCLFHKKELVGEVYYEEEDVFVKFRKPNSYYMRWTKGEDKGQEVLYSQGRYNNELQAHSGGFLGFVTVSLDPEGSMALRKGKHPIYQLDIGHLLNLVQKNYDLHKELGAGSIVFEGEEVLKGTRTLRFRADFPPGKGFYAKRNYLHFDADNCLPIRIEAYDWKDRLMERFHFSHVRLNRGYTDKDFDIENREYNF